MARPVDGRLGLKQVSVPHGEHRRWVVRATCSLCPVTKDMVPPRSNPHKGEYEDLLHSAGWSTKNGRCVCPDCLRRKQSGDRRVEIAPGWHAILPSTPIEQEPEVTEAAIPLIAVNEPDRNMKRKIHDAIAGEWDEARGRYMNDTSDQALANKLNCPRKWIEDIRLDFFGDSGTNDDLEQLKAAMKAAVERFEKTADDALKIATNLDAQARELKELRGRLERVEKSVLPRGR